MAGQVLWEVRPDGSVRTDGLHLEGFARVLWDTLRASGYATPPTYEALETTQLGVPCCWVRVTVQLHPNHPEWPDLSMDVKSIRMMETLEVAALRVLNTFGDQHPLEVSSTPVGLLPTVDPEDPAWRDRMGDMAALLTMSTPLDVLQAVVRCMNALYRLQALRSVAATELSAVALDTAGVLGVRNHHLRFISVNYMVMERDLAEARLRIAELEAGEAHWVTREAQWVDQLADRVQTIVGLQEGREQMQVEMDQMRDEHLQHLQIIAQMEEQLELMDQDLEAANGFIMVLQHPPEPPVPGAMEGDPDDAQSMLDSEGPQPEPMEIESSASSASSVGDLDDF